MRKALTLSWLALSIACAGMQRDDFIRRQVSYLENCPEKDIKILSRSKVLPAVEVEACGVTKRYQDVATYVGVDRMPHWQEIITSKPEPTSKQCTCPEVK